MKRFSLVIFLCILFLWAVSSEAAVEVSGTISQDTIWSSTDSPYLVTGDVTIGSGVTLTIEPGTRIEFVKNSDDQQGGWDSSKCELTVYGTLIAQGTASERVVFTSSAATPQAGDWCGILFFGGQGTLDYCNIEYASYYAVYIDNAAPVISHSIISQNAGYGVYCSSLSNPLIDGNTISNNAYGGVYIEDSSATIINNTIQNNGQDWGPGITCYSSSPQDGFAIVISGNTISGSSNGVYCYGVSRADITGNTINDNQYGICTDSPGLISHNTITGNDCAGISFSISYGFSGYAPPLINWNTIHSNGAQPCYGMGGYDIENWSGYSINARYNWWGDVATAEMNSGGNPKNISTIYDYFDDVWSGYGIVNYSGWLGSENGTPVSTVSTGVVQLTDAGGRDVDNYRSEGPVYIQVTDPDLNTDPDVIENVTIHITSDTEDTGTPSSATPPVPGSNVGDGGMSEILTGPTTLNENWTLTYDGQYGVFSVTGSVSGRHADAIPDTKYVSTNGEVAFTIYWGTCSFGPGDTFTFSTVAGSPVTEPVILTESDPASGIFRGSIACDNSGSGSPDGDLDVSTGDRITVLYNDSADDWGVGRIHADTALYTVTTVSGEISEDTTWTPSDSPYFVTGDITVNPGITLTLEPGTKIVFLNRDDQQSGRNKNKSEIIIKGRLIAQGTSSQTIVFTSSSKYPERGDWHGLFFSGGQGLIDYCVIQYAYDGIYLQGASPVVANSTLSHNANYGIYSSGSSDARIEGNTISENNSGGIYCGSASDLRIERNTISKNNSDGIYCYQSSPIITGNRILNHWNAGIRCYGSSGYSSPVITNNTLVGNSSGIAGSHVHITIRNNVLRNQSDAISLYDTGNVIIEFNTVTGNGRGVYCHFGQSCIVNGNIITHNLSGICGSDASEGYVLAHNNVWGNNTNCGDITAGETDLSIDPLYNDILSGDLGLQTGSPLLTAGEGDTQIGAYGGGGNPPAVIIAPSTIPTTSGILSQNEIWSGEIHIAADVTVPQNVILKIDPGTTITFSDSTGLYIDGELIAAGTPDAGITLTSASFGPVPGIWKGITFNDSSLDISMIQDAIIEYAENGIYCSAASPSLNSLLIRNNETGIYLTSIYYYLPSSDPYINGCTIANNARGILVYSSKPEITDNLFVQNAQGIEAYYSGLTIRHNVMRNCTENAIFLNYCPQNTAVEFNTITNSHCAIRLAFSYSVVDSNIVTGNTYGTYSSGSYDFLCYNDIWGNNTNYQGIAPGGGDISVDPLFVSETDFHLQPGSPCIDRGDPYYLDEDGSQADIGAYGGRGGYNGSPDNLLPDRPVNSSPTDGTTGLLPSLVLSAGPFSDPDATDFQTAAQWQIRTETGDYFSPVFDSGENKTKLNSITVTCGTLQTGATYFWHVRYKDNKNAWSDYSEETSFSTAPDLIPPETTITQGPPEGSTSGPNVTFQWSGTDNSGCPIVYSWQMDEGEWSAFSSSVSRSFTNLSHGSHVFSVKAMDGDNNINDSPAVRNFNVDAVLPVVSNVRVPAEQIIGRSVHVLWETDEPASSHVEYWVDGGSHRSAGNWTLKTSHDLNLTGLRPNTTYNVIAYSRDAWGNESSRTGQPVTFTTLDDVPPPDITNLSVRFFDTRLVFTWNHSADTYGDLAGYKVYFNGATEPVLLDKSINTYEYVSLSPGTGYTFKITAYDTTGNESRGVSIAAVTLLPNPSGISVVPYSGYVVLNWSGVNPSQYVKHYAVYVRNSEFSSVEGLTPQLATTSTCARVSGLSNNVTYYFAVTAVNISGGEKREVTNVTGTPDVSIAEPALLSQGKPVTGSAYYNSGSEVFPYTTINDGRLNDTGTAYDWSFWLTPNHQTGYAIIDLEHVYAVSRFEIQNTHNRFHNDRGTKDFRISVSLDNVNYTEVVDDDLAAVGGMNPIPVEIFYVTPVNARYIRFDIDTTYGSYGSGGINEIFVFGVPASISDTEGPAVSDLKLNGVAFRDGEELHDSGTFTLSAADPYGMSRVEFFLDGIPYRTDTNGADGYSCLLDLLPISDGSHILTVMAYDSFGNSTRLDYNITAALEPPATPIVTVPANGTITNIPAITVKGSAGKETEVVFFDNGVQTGISAAVNAYGNFSGTIALTEGENRIQAAARNRAGTSPLTGEILITLDTSLPRSPTRFSGQAISGGVIRLTWMQSADAVKGYNLYRSTSSFTSSDQATPVNSSLITGILYADMPPGDTTYYYRIESVNAAGTKGPLSPEVVVRPDRTMPRAVSISYAPRGKYDQATGRMAPGPVNVLLRVSEPLQVVPFLSITPSGGAPISILLTKVSDLEYSGLFIISDTTPGGTAYAVFSGRDSVGNRGTEIDSGGSIEIDTRGPAITQIIIQPADPIKNNPDNPVTVAVFVGLNDAMKPGSIPELSYFLSGTGRVHVPIAVQETTPEPGQVQAWQGTFTLPSDAGMSAAETLQFIYKGIDDLDNVNTGVLCKNSFQVYQGDLPPLSAPQGLKGKSLPGGRISLSWNSVEEAAGYVLYRQAPGAGELTEYKPLGPVLEYLDEPGSDGIYKYAVASIRQENGQEAISGQSNAVQVVSDRVPPEAPLNLALALTSKGIAAQWEAPFYTERVSYSLYRSSLPEITSVLGLTPVITGIQGTVALDAHPSQTDHSYVVTAVDDAGNESLPSNSPYLNFELLPVSTLQVIQNENDSPVISWTHSGQSISGYDFYIGPEGSLVKINSDLLIDTSYTDMGFTGDERRYTVVAVDSYGKESLGRSIVLPVLCAEILDGEVIHKGLMNRLEYRVENYSSTRVDHIKLRVGLDKYENISEEFGLDPGEAQIIPVVIGGYADLPDTASLTATIEVIPEEGEKVEIVRGQTIEVVPGTLDVTILNTEFTRGGSGQAQFVIKNTSEEEIEIITGRRSGASDEVAFSLLDPDGNTLAIIDYNQILGEQIVTLPNGTKVARIPSGSLFTSEPVTLSVPVSAPTDLTLQLEIDQVHYHLGKPDQVSMQGLTTRRRIALIQTSYHGEITSITPEVSRGEDVLIAGRALDRDTGNPLPRVPLNLIVTLDGFERQYKVFTDGTGAFSYTFKPLAGESGLYKASALHPDLLDRPVQGEFEVTRIKVEPESLDLYFPRNYENTISVVVTAGESTTTGSLRLVCEAGDQPSGVLPAGIHVDPGSSVNVLRPGESCRLEINVWGDNNAAATESIILAVKEGDFVWRVVPVNIAFSEAGPILHSDPDYLETGLGFGEPVSEYITLQNKGLVDLTGVSLALVSEDGRPTPSWVHLNSDPDQGTIAAGEEREIAIYFSPSAGVAVEGSYRFFLRVSSSNGGTTDIPIFVSLTQSGVGNAFFKVTDIYTGTLGPDGRVIQGLDGARITLQKDDNPAIELTEITQDGGEAFFADLTVGSYKCRITAEKHEQYTGRVWVKPGVTVSKDVFLPYNLVTVEWQVVPTTIGDKYEIILNAAYETDVPAPVVIPEPMSFTLPDMQPGDIYNAEYTLTNYGLVSAESLKFIPRMNGDNFKCEMMKGVPDRLGAKERITVPFRVTCLASAGQGESGGGAGDGGSGGIQMPYGSPNPCIGGSAEVIIYSGGAGGSGGVPWHSHYSGGDGDDEGWGRGSWGSTSTHSSNCLSPRPKPKNPPHGGPPDGGGSGGSGGAGGPVGPGGDPPPGPDPDCSKSLVDPLRGDYEDTITDLSIKVPGHRINVVRHYHDGDWHLNHFEQELELVYENSRLAYISKSGVQYSRAGEQSSVFTAGAEWWIYSEEGGYRWEDKRGNWSDYDSTGRMLSYGDGNGLKVSVIYDPVDNRLTGLADNRGRQVLWYEYTDGKVSAVQDASGRRVEYYHEAEKLTRVKDVLGYDTFYTYDSGGRLASKEDPEGRKVFITYDGGFVTSVTDENGIGQFWEYADTGGWEFYTLTRSSSGKVIERWFDNEGRKKRKDVNGRTIETILRDGRQVIVRDAAGRETCWELDEWDNVISVTYPDGSSVRYEYETEYANVTKKIDERGVTAYLYDNNGNLLRQVEAAGISSERIIEYTYDSDGSLLRVKQVVDANTPEAITVMTYDDSGNMESFTDPEANTSWFIYDIMGNVLTKKDGRGKTWTHQYDNKGQLTSSKDPLESITQFFYDKVGNRIKEIDAEEKRITYQYDNNDNLLSRTTPSGIYSYEYNLDELKTKETDPEGKVIRYEYDLDGRLVKTIDGNGNEVINEYGDTTGGCTSCAGLRNQPKRTIFPTFTKEYAYDKRGRRTEEKDILSDVEEYSTLFTYDAVGNLMTKVDKEGKSTRYEYDQLNRLIKVTDPLQQETKYTYDDRNNLIALEDANHNVTRFEYDRNNRLIKEKRPMGQETVHQYDGVGNLIAKTDAKNQKTEYEYDDAGRLITTRYFSAEDHATPLKTVTFTYNKLGKLKSYNDSETSAQYVYNDSHQKTLETVDYGVFELSYSYAYYGNGKKKSFAAPGGITYEYTYDAANQLESVFIPGQGYITYNSYAWTRPSSITLPGGTTKEYNYDPLMRIKSIAVKDPVQNVLMNYGYAYDRMDNILRKETEHSAYECTYDDLYRLTNVNNPTLPDEAYTYDPVGNRLTAGDVPGTWQYNSNNELLAYDATSCEYDTNGNLTRKTTGTQVMEFFYDVENRLVRVQDGTGSVVASYYYDPFGRRLWKQVGAAKINFFYSEEGLVGEYDASGTEIRSYGYRPDSTWTTDPLFMKQSGDWYWYHCDHLGTPRQMTATNGAVLWSAKYKAFGEAEVDPGSIVTNNLRFPGQYFDQETGLHHNYFRDYDPGIGRYTEKDPIGLRGGINLYAYAANNPVCWKDVFGLSEIRQDCKEKCGTWKVVRDNAGDSILNCLCWLDCVAPDGTVLKEFREIGAATAFDCLCPSENKRCCK